MRVLLIAGALTLAFSIQHVTAQALQPPRVVFRTDWPLEKAIADHIREGDRQVVLFNLAIPGLSSVTADVVGYVKASDIIVVGTLDQVSSRLVLKRPNGVVTPASPDDANWIQSLLGFRVERLMKNRTDWRVVQGDIFTTYRDGGTAMFGAVRVDAVTNYLPPPRQGARFLVFGRQSMERGEIVRELYEEGSEGLLVSTSRDPDPGHAGSPPVRNQLERLTVEQAAAAIEQEVRSGR